MSKLLGAIREIGGEPISLAPDDQTVEFGNTHWLDATIEERSTLSVDQVVSAFLETASALRHRVQATDANTATFYVWHDEQAGQLRCSVSSQPTSRLPFRGNYYPTNDLGGVVAGFLDNGSPGFLPWDELRPAGEDPPSADTRPAFPVWTFDLASAPRDEKTLQSEADQSLDERSDAGGSGWKGSG